VARSIPNEIRASLVAPLERLAGLEPFTLLTRSNDALKAMQDIESRIGALRRKAVRELRAQGYTLREIAEPLGVKPQRIHQLEIGYDRAEKKARRGV
jgi:DNA-directed RNA polymerase specialized sigma24 family protein